MANKTLLAAAQLIEDKGWVRGEMKDNFGRHCFVGALYEVSDYRETGKLISCIRKHLGIHPMSWNDTIAKSKKEVVRKMRELAEVC